MTSISWFLQTLLNAIKSDNFAIFGESQYAT